MQINENWTARWNKMQYSIDPMVKDEEGSRLPPPLIFYVSRSPFPDQHDAMLAALSVSLSAGFYYQTNFDDVLAIARPFAQNQGRGPPQQLTKAQT